MKNKIFSTLLILLAFGCSDSLKDLEPMPQDGGSQTVDVDGCENLIDATHDDNWVFWDFDRGMVVAEGEGWDISFRRFHVRMNQHVETQAQHEVVFEDVIEDPTLGFHRDGVLDNGDPSYFISDGDHQWWSYDSMKHILHPYDKVYLIRSTEGKLYKMRFLSYYDDAGTSAKLSFAWAPLDMTSTMSCHPNGGGMSTDASYDMDAMTGASMDAGMDSSVDAEMDSSVDAEMDASSPTYDDMLSIDATSREAWVYLDLESRSLSNDKNDVWDVAFLRSRIQTNSGTSADGETMAGAKRSDTNYDELSEVGSGEFVVDEMMPVPGPPGSGEFSGSPALNSWYNYDSVNHTLSPKDEAYLLRSKEGAIYKMKILSWESGAWVVRVAEMEAN